jgi:hypothetical protein
MKVGHRRFGYPTITKRNNDGAVADIASNLLRTMQDHPASPLLEQADMSSSSQLSRSAEALPARAAVTAAQAVSTLTS